MSYTVQRKNINSKCKAPISRLKVWKQITLELYVTFLSLTQLKEQVTVTQSMDRPWGFQEFQALRFQANWHTKVLRFSALSTGHLYPRKYFWYSFLLKAESAPGTQCGRKDYVNENSSDTIGNRIGDLPACSAVSQPNSPPPACQNIINREIH